MKKFFPEIIALGVYDASLVYKNASETPSRRVWMYEIEVILADGGTTHIDNAAYPIRAGNVIIGKPGHIRHTELPFQCLYLHVMTDDSELKGMLDAMPNMYTPSANIAEQMHHLITAYTMPETDAGMRTGAALCTLLATLISDTRYVGGTTHHGNPHTEIMDRAIAFMDTNFSQNLTLAEIADSVYLNKFYFRKLFLAATGRTPYRYLLERRLSHAKKLLMTTNLSIGAISRECGFSSQSYFNQVFSRECGCTPSGYKKQMSMQYSVAEK